MGEIIQFKQKKKKEYRSPQQRLEDLIHVGAEQSDYILAHGSPEPVVVLTFSQVVELMKIFKAR